MDFLRISKTSAQSPEGTVVQIMPDGSLMHLSLSATFLMPLIEGPGQGPDIVEISKAFWADRSPVDADTADLLKPEIEAAYAVLERSVVFA